MRILTKQFVFDGRNVLDHAALSEIGFEVHAIGKTVSDAARVSME
jgi:hypothetical protein